MMFRVTYTNVNRKRCTQQGNRRDELLIASEKSWNWNVSGDDDVPVIETCGVSGIVSSETETFVSFEVECAAT